MSVDVYLISRVQWNPRMLFGSVVGPADRFKVGYSANPFDRLEQLKNATGHNLALWGVVMCGNEEAALRIERKAHALLAPHRRRGEWFECPFDQAWEKVREAWPASAVRLTEWYDIDLDTMRLVPFRRGAWSGVSDAWHDYRDYKVDGLRTGLFADFPLPGSGPVDHRIGTPASAAA